MSIQLKVVLPVLCFGMLILAASVAPAEAQRAPSRSDFKINDLKAQQMLEEKMPRIGCTIKGNVSRVGKKRIYRMPDSPNYERMRMDFKRGDRWFCTEDDAAKAGFKPARR